MRNNAVRRIALVYKRLEDLHALPSNFRASQPSDQFFALAGKHRPDNHFDPAHIALDDIHEFSPGRCGRLTQLSVEIPVHGPDKSKRPYCFDAAPRTSWYSAALKNGANALMTAVRKASCLVIMLRVKTPHAP